MGPAFNPPLPFAKPWLPPYSKITERFRSAWDQASVTKGALTQSYELAVSSFLGVDSALAVSSCTTGLIMALRALNLKGDCLIPSFTFTSTVQALLWNQLNPVFVDCHPRRFTIDLESLAASVTPQVSAVVATYVFGNPPSMNALEEFCTRHRLPLVLDAAHAFGTLWKGKPVGVFGNAEVFSTSATKLLCTGEGGVITTGDSRFADSIRSLREYGHGIRYETVNQGLNGRMTEFQSVMGLEGLALLEEHAKHRNRLSTAYKESLHGLPISFQEIESQARSSYKDFAILLEDEWNLSRDEVGQKLHEQGIPTRNYFSPPLHRQKFFASHLSRPVELPVTEGVCSRILCLPMYYDLKEEQIKRIGEVFESVYKDQRKMARRSLP